MYNALPVSSSRSKTWTVRGKASEKYGVPIPTSLQPCQITDRLYISNLLTASLYLKGIAAAYFQPGPRITHVLSIISGRVWQVEVTRRTSESRIVHKTILLSDSQTANIMEHLPEICAFIRSALSMPNSQVLVHCYAGVSRSASAIAACLMYSRRISHNAAIALLRINRPIANPNPGFCLQLGAWHNMKYDLLEEDSSPKDVYTWTCGSLELKENIFKQMPALDALKRFHRPQLNI